MPNGLVFSELTAKVLILINIIPWRIISTVDGTDTYTQKHPSRLQSR